VHLVGFIIRIYHDARSPERQIGRMRIQQAQANTLIMTTHRLPFGRSYGGSWISGTDSFLSSNIGDERFRNYLLPSTFLHMKHSYSIFYNICWKGSDTIPYGCCWILVLHFTWPLVLPETSLHLAVKSEIVISKVRNSLSLCHRCKIKPPAEFCKTPTFLNAHRCEILRILALPDLKRVTKGQRERMWNETWHLFYFSWFVQGS